MLLLHVSTASKHQLQASSDAASLHMRLNCTVNTRPLHIHTLLRLLA